MRSIVLAMLLCKAFYTLNAQTNIQGIVVENNDIPIPFTNVYIPQLEKGTITDENGVFIIEDIPLGTYKVIFSIMGYETQSLNLQIPTKESIVIVLSQSAIEMEEIIISTPFHKLQSENVMKVDHEKISDLKAKGALNLSDGLSNIPGVESVTTGVSIGKPVIRGLSSNRVLVYTQGVRLENQQFGDEHGLGLNDAGIESVEVIKGPASLLYGSDALGGVLYLNPERFAKENASSADASFNYFSNTQGYNTNLGYKSSDDVFKFIFRGSLAEHSDYKTKQYRVTNTRFKEQDFKGAIGYQISKFKSEMRYNVNNALLGIPEGIDVQSKNVTPLVPYQNITNHVLSSKSVLFLNNSTLDFNFGLLYNNRKEFENFMNPILHMKLKTFNYDLKYNLPVLGKFETIVGVQGMNQTNTNYGEEQLIPDATTNDFGILATSHIHFKDVDIQIGARYDNRVLTIENEINKSFNSFNGAAGIKTKIADKVTLRLNLATGFRAPNLAELTSDGVHEGTNRYEIGNVDLKNEQNFQTDLSIEFKNEHIELFTNAFFNKVNNYIFISPNGQFIDNAPVFVYSQNDAALYGGEFGFHFHPHPLDWLHFESSFETVVGKQNNEDYLPLIPANSLNNTIRIEYKNGFVKDVYSYIKLNITFKQDNVSNFESITSGYNLLSAGFGGKIKLLQNELSISIAGTNLTNRTYVNHLSRLKSENIFNIGRNISLGLTYSL
jgi:iron complex outermembrane receptor protein